MLLLDYQNVLIQNVLTERFSGAAPVSIDQTVSDFDGVLFHISTPETKTKIQVSILLRCYEDLVKYGAHDVLQREYGPYIVDPEPGFQFSIVVDLEQLPAEAEEREALVRKIALLKRNMMAAPFEAAFAEYYKLKEAASQYTSEEAPQGVREGGEVMAIHYREEEAIYVKASHDRVTVIFSTVCLARCLFRSLWTLGGALSKTHRRFCFATTRHWSCRMFRAFRSLATARLAM